MPRTTRSEQNYERHLSILSDIRGAIERHSPRGSDRTHAPRTALADTSIPQGLKES